MEPIKPSEAAMEMARELIEDDIGAEIAKRVMSDFLGVPLEECSEKSRGALLIREGIRLYRQALTAAGYKIGRID